MNMWYETIILIPIFLLSLTLANAQVVNDMKGHGMERETAHNVLYAQTGSMPTEKNNGTKIPETKESNRSRKQESSKAKNESTLPEPIEKSAPLKDFVPSEKIEADKAVDFPADI